MGSQSCTQMCEKTPQSDEFGDILHTQYMLTCVVCNLQMVDSRMLVSTVGFRRHIDQQHYAAISEEKGDINVECLLCGRRENSLEEIGRHVREQHGFVGEGSKSQLGLDSRRGSRVGKEAYNEGRDEQTKMNQTKRREVIRLSSKRDFEVLWREEDRCKVSVDGEEFSGQIKVKEYRGADYDASEVQAQLVWYPIFRSPCNYTFFFIEEEPKQRSILCKAYLFRRD